MQKESIDESLAKAFQSKYEVFVRDHGDLYETRQVPLDEADIKNIAKSYFYVRIFLSFCVILFSVTLYFRLPLAFNDYLIGGTLATIILFGFIWSYCATTKLELKNEKTVIKGVLTGKRKYYNGKFEYNMIRISQREEIKITPVDYEKLSYGSVLQVEILDNSFWSVNVPKVSLIGKVPIAVEELPVEKTDNNSVWARAGRYMGRLIIGKK